MAQAYESQGNTEARRIYDRVVKEYAAQKDAVLLARARLGVEAPAGRGARTVWEPPTYAFWDVCWGSLSPDGRLISYSDDGRLVLHDVEAGTDHNVTNATTTPACESVISPDGKHIAFRTRDRDLERNMLSVVDIAGSSAPRVVYDNPDVYDLLLHDWSRACDCLAVAVHRLDRTVQIALVPPAGGSPRVLRSLDWRGVDTMRFSPDGRHLAYSVTQSDTVRERDIFVLAVDGSGAEVLAVEHPAADDVLVDWSPDGRWLLFTSDRRGTKDLWAVPIEGSQPVQDPRLLRRDLGGSSFTSLGWTPSGALYYLKQHPVSLRNGTVRLASIDAAAGRYVSTPVGTRGHLENVRIPRWSPDGRSLAYLSSLRTSPGPQALMVQSMETGTTRAIALRPAHLQPDRIVSWTPDAGAIVVAATGSLKGLGLYLVDLETSSASPVVRPDESPVARAIAGAQGIAWLPDGLSFLVRAALSPASVADPPKAGIYRIDTRTGDSSVVVLDAESWIGDMPTMSPAGTSFYYKQVTGPTDRSAQTEAFIERDLVTGREREVIRRTVLSRIHLSPDGRFIATASTDAASGSRVLLLVSTENGQTRELMRVPAGVNAERLNNLNLGRGLDVNGWMPDSRSLLVVTLPRDGITRDRDLEPLIVPVEGGQPRRIVGDVGIGNSANASPDGRHFLIYLFEPPTGPSSEVGVLENLLPAGPTPRQ
jgi:Tol biopolymer transport system component